MWDGGYQCIIIIFGEHLFWNKAGILCTAQEVLLLKRQFSETTVVRQNSALWASEVWQMEKKAAFIPVWILIIVILAACRPSQAELDGHATQVAADIFATLTAAASPSTPAPAEAATAPNVPIPEPLALGSVQVNEGDCPEGSGNASCIRAMVSCPRLAESPALLRVSGDGSAGTILLTTGGSGGGLYRIGGENGEGAAGIGNMMDTFLDEGYMLVEVQWKPPRIWDTSNDAGSITLACRAATIFQWVHENLHLGGLFAAQGNSGGSAQIAFSLAYYGIDDFLDVANLGGGPPPCPIVYAVGGKPNYDEQTQCVGGPGEWDELKEPMLSGNPRLHYPNTVVNFFLGENEPSEEVKLTARAYYEAITSQKTRLQVPNTGHGVHRTEEGQKALMEAIWKAEIYYRDGSIGRAGDDFIYVSRIILWE